MAMAVRFLYIMLLIMPESFLLIYDANPLEDIQVIVVFKNRLKLLIKDGKIYQNEL